MKTLAIATGITAAALAVQAGALAFMRVRQRRRKPIERLRLGLVEDMRHRTETFGKRAGRMRDDVRHRARTLLERRSA